MTDKYYEIRNYLSNNINDFKETVSEEFINYYGIEYKNEIISRLNDTNFVFYVNTNLRTFSSFPFYKINCSKNSYNDIKKEFKIVKKEILKNNYDNAIYSSDKRIFPLKEIIDSNRTCLDCYNEITNKIEKVIYVPLFNGHDESLIHEMIHSIMTSPLCYTDIKGRKCVFKIGFTLCDSKMERLLEECLTEIDAKKIYKKVHNKYIFLDKFYPLYKSECMYDKYIPFVIDFYNKYMVDINYSRFNLNKNHILSLIGKNNYDIFLSLINEYYSNSFPCGANYYINEVKKLVKKM